jgi:hypothetical protein
MRSFWKRRREPNLPPRDDHPPLWAVAAMVLIISSLAFIMVWAPLGAGVVRH